jgi:hypothetical protein
MPLLRRKSKMRATRMSPGTRKRGELGVGMGICSHEEVIFAGMDPR